MQLSAKHGSYERTPLTSSCHVSGAHSLIQVLTTDGVSVVLGTQWGDEGKGKLVDILAQHADYVCRYVVSQHCSFRLYSRIATSFIAPKQRGDFGPSTHNFLSLFTLC